MKIDKEQEFERKIKQLETQVAIERKAYRLLFEAISDLVGRAVNENVYDAIKRFRELVNIMFVECLKILNKRGGNIEFNKAVNDAITKFQRRSKMPNRNRENETQEGKLLTIEDAFCAVDNTKCDGSCQQKALEGNSVHCSMAVPERFTLNKAARIKKGFQRATRDRYDRDDE